MTLSKTEPDDFPISHPDFSTAMRLEIPDKAINTEGDFEIIYDKAEINHIDYYNKHPYGAYGYGDRPLLTINNLKYSGASNKKLLVIKDSFGDTMVPLISLGCKNIAAVDIRHFDGSLRTLIKSFHPDVVIILYTNAWAGPINWNNHGDEFDFR